MGAKIAALREAGWVDEITDKAQWDNMTRSFGAELQLVTDFADVIYEKDYSVVVMDETGETNLEDFIHPENAIYVFGRSTMNNLQRQIHHDHSVRIVTPEQKSMFGCSVACAVLYARSLQWR